MNKDNNVTEEDESNWLHRNDAYQIQHVPHKNSTIIRDTTEGKLFVVGTGIQAIAILSVTVN
jgi:hypothetical protein